MDLVDRHGERDRGTPAGAGGGRHRRRAPEVQERPVVLLATIDGEDVPLAEIHELLAGRFAKWQLPTS